MALFDFASEADSYKRLLQTPDIGVTEADYNPPAPVAPVAEPSAGLMMPQSPLEQVLEKNGKGKTLGKMALTALSGGLLAPILMPELIGAGKRYEAEMDAYADDLTAQRMAERMESIDFDNLQPEDIAYLNAASKDLGEFGTDMLAAQMTGLGGDEAIASHFGYNAYQWNQLSPEKRRDLTDRYNYQTGGAGAFDYRLNAEGKSPEQVQQAKQAELYGSGLGQQYADDRQLITGVRGQVMKADQTMESIDHVMDLLQDPDNDDLTGIERQIRDMFWANRREDGTLDAVTAQGIVDLISQATFGALSQSELDLLKGGFMNPERSVDYNIGTLTQARKRVEDDRERYISSAQGAAERYSKWKGQDDYGSLMSDDWNYLNVGEGSRIKPIVFMQDGEEKTVTFSDYYKKRMEQAGPYEDLSREQVLIDYRKAREAEKELWEKQQETQRQLQEEARRALELEFQE